MNEGANEFPLNERLKHLVGSSQNADFTFIIEDVIEDVIEDDNVEIPAHKIIIAAASPVLHRIVYGTGQFSGANYTKVDGISKESFMEILRYIYTDKFNVNDDNVFDILNKANYYGLSFVETKCFDYLREHLNSSTVTWIYHQLFHSYSSSELLKRCLRIIQLNPIVCFTAEEFSKFGIDEFKSILELEAINCSEMDLFEAMLKLAKSHCTLHDLEPTGPNQRRVLEGAENLLRLEALTKCELDCCINQQSDFFSSTEIERFYVVIDNKLSTTVVKRNHYTFKDSIWLTIATSNELPPSCFYAGSSQFIFRFIESGKEILPYSFHPSDEYLQRDDSAIKAEFLCGSGYEWRNSNGEIPQGAVAITQDDGKEVFIGRGMYYSQLTIGPTYNGRSMYVVDWEDETKHELFEFEILVAVNVKNPYTGNGIPYDAIFIGLNENNFKTYLGRAWHLNDLLPAKVILEENTSYVSYGVAEITKSDFDYVRMDAGTYEWEKAANGNVPSNAIEGGVTENGETLYFGRVFHDGIYIPGKVHPSHKTFYAPYQRQEMHFESYEVLVKNVKTVQAENC